MKKLFIIVLIIWAHAYANGQAQRLAMLPYSMKLIDAAGASYLPTLCVDYFNDVPKAKDAYSVMGQSPNLAGMDIHGVDTHFDKVKIKDLNGHHTTPRINQTTYLSPEGNSEALPAAYTDFIEARAKHYEIGGFNKAKQKLLQKDVWAYDIMNRLGYIDENIADANTRFNRAKAAFKNDFLQPNATVQNAEIIDFAFMLKLSLHGNAPGVETPLVFKGGSGRYIVFNDIAPPIYRGTDEGEVASAIHSNSNGNKLIMKTLGFENETKARAFQFDIKERFDANYSKDISAVNADIFNESSYLTKKCDYSILEDFDRTKIVRSGEYYSADMIIRASDDGVNKLAKIDAFSNSEEAIPPFFTGIGNRITRLRERFELLFFLKDLRKSIVRKMGPHTNLYVVITNQLGSKVIVEIKNGKMLNTHYFACE